MSNMHQELRPLKRHLDDYLGKPPQYYLGRELDLALHVGNLRDFIRRTPYPLDWDTAEAVQGIIAHQVVPWSVLELDLQRWAYRAFFKNAVENEIAWNNRTRKDAEAVIPDLEYLRCYSAVEMPPNVADPWGEDFLDECECLMSVIREGFVFDQPPLAGRFVCMPFLPVGAVWLSRVPLIEKVWMDRRVVELCEASALLAAAGYIRLPPSDPHSLALHRFFPLDTQWKSPAPAPHGHFFEALRQAEAAVRTMPARSYEISGRPFVFFDDYAAWPGRRVPDDLRSPGMKEDGIVRARWDALVDEYAEDGLIEVAGYYLSKLSVGWDLADGETVRIYSSLEAASSALDERLPALDELALVAANAAARSTWGRGWSELQRRIFTCLQGRAMTADQLCEELKRDRRTLFRPGGIKELTKKKIVMKSRRIGGYYRPDWPPALSEWA
jgi:hypothetical protein